jgi:multidrug efflux pump subunit AcrB
VVATSATVVVGIVLAVVVSVTLVAMLALYVWAAIEDGRDNARTQNAVRRNRLRHLRR